MVSSTVFGETAALFISPHTARETSARPEKWSNAFLWNYLLSIPRIPIQRPYMVYFNSHFQCTPSVNIRITRSCVVEKPSIRPQRTLAYRRGLLRR